MNPALEIPSVLKGERPRVGVVTVVKGRKLLVSTSEGMKEIDNTSSQLIKVGDGVKLNGAVFLGKMKDESQLPVFQV